MILPISLLVFILMLNLLHQPADFCFIWIICFVVNYDIKFIQNLHVGQWTVSCWTCSKVTRMTPRGSSPSTTSRTCLSTQYLPRNSFPKKVSESGLILIFRNDCQILIVHFFGMLFVGHFLGILVQIWRMKDKALSNPKINLKTRQ